MKESPPLALSTSSSSSSSDFTTEDNMDNMEINFGECFPEMLARDLEMSSAMFQAKNMSAGTPSMSILYEESDKPRIMSCPGRILTSPYHASSRVQTLGAIEERDSVMSFIDHHEYGNDANCSDVESNAETDISGGMEPPSVRLRETSIVTAATSLTSASDNTPPSPKDLLANRNHHYSWIDVDSEDDNEVEEPETKQEQETQPIALSPRPKTPLKDDSIFDVIESPQSFSRSRNMHRPTHRINRSTSYEPATSPKKPKKKLSMQSVYVPVRKASLSHTPSPTDTTHAFQPVCADAKRHSVSRRRSLQLPQIQYTQEDEPATNKLKVKHRKSFHVQVDEESVKFDNESMLGIHQPSWHQQRPNTVYIQPSPPPSPLPSVQSWLDGSNPPYQSQMVVDDLAKAVPLPPDVIETLRVSIACFPETMLLTSSLTVETIRAYSRKVPPVRGRLALPGTP
ncbi:hypothetical protein G7046_g7324 [Stylonectria norvegica]|nr:hypothetical protein G7046_g7324 [Stylonectria norvegica]